MDADEERVAEYLSGLKLVAERFSKEEMRNGKTPDFRVLRDGELLFYCEVKSSMRDRWLDQQLEAVAPGQLAGGEKNDPIFNRLAADIHTAIKQFDAVNADQKYPNVLALVNHDDMCGDDDLVATITGNFYDDHGAAHPIYRQFSHGRIKDEKERVHLFLWLEDGDRSHLLFNESHKKHHATLLTAFGVDRCAVRQSDP